MKEKNNLPLVCAILFFCAVPFIVLGNTIHFLNILDLLFSSSVSIAIGVGILLKKDLVIVIASGINVAAEIINLLMYNYDNYNDYYYDRYRFVDFICDVAPLSAGLVCAVILFLFVLFLFLPKFKNKENISKLWMFPSIMFIIATGGFTMSNIILSVAYFMLLYIYSSRDYHTDIEAKNDIKDPNNKENGKIELDLVTELKILKAKLDVGSITEEEYNSKKKNLLGL